MSAYDYIVSCLTAMQNNGTKLSDIDATAKEMIRLVRNEAAGDIRDSFPDPNPLASLFKPYVGDLISESLENDKPF